jgi:transaldolase/glucose-6-phosphate isomerase
MATNRLAVVAELGQSIWYDNIRRGLITSGDLQRLIDEDSVVGITSNPTIFEKAIDGSSDYDDAIKALVGSGVTDGQQIFEALAIEDIQHAADILRPIYDRSKHVDGYISLEVSPASANDTKKTIAEARSLFERVERPNVMIKIPATLEGLPAIEHMIYEGVNINVTLIFSLDRYRAVAEAFLRGLELRAREGQPVRDIASVASFFVSRVDTMIDKQLDEKIAATSDAQQADELRALHGKAAIANARVAYDAYKSIFHGERFAALKSQGAMPQRCLWASTSTKNPAYRDVLYVEELIGPETVDTMPPQTIVAFQDHGKARSSLDAEDISASNDVLRRLAAAGIEMDAVTHQLELDGVKSFADSYTELIKSTTEKAQRLHGEVQASGDTPSAAPTAATATVAASGVGTASLGTLQSQVDATLRRADDEQFARRVWAKDPALWKPNPSEQSEITDRLGWLTVADQMSDALPRLNELRDDVRSAGFTSCVLLGMGGSSLAPEVFRETFGSATGQPKLFVLDSTDPATILAVEGQIDLAHTLFIVASKSGGTIETLSHFKHFYAKVREIAPEDAGKQFIAITDPGTKLEDLARENGFRATFRNQPDIGGRYSALSYFGLAPAAILGIDIATLLDRARAMEAACAPGAETDANPGLWLGAIIGTAALAGRDKLTLVISPPVATFGYWVEQLIAESTGKEGKGILPVEGETLGAPEVYGADRLFVYLRTNDGFDARQDAAVAALEQAGQPVVTLPMRDTYDVGGEFFRWEFATAVAGALLDINAFDQPNVQEAKDRTNAILDQYRVTRELPQPAAILRTEHVAVIGGEGQSHRLVDAVSLQAALEAYAAEAKPGDYFALLAYIERTPKTQEALQAIRLRLRDLARDATTLGYGPRFQHSTGQLHKGGPNTGVFLQFVADDAKDVAIPDEPYTFGVLKQAQALGDLQALEAHGRRVIRLNLGADIAAGLGELREALDASQLPR